MVKNPLGNLWFGIVEDRNDPLMVGRIRVRVYGLHTEDKTPEKGIPTEDLPWATCMFPVDTASMGGLGASPSIQTGQLVFLLFLDPETQQFPFVLGAVPGRMESFWREWTRINPDGTYDKDPDTEEELNEWEEPRTTNKGFCDPYGNFPLPGQDGIQDNPGTTRGRERCNPHVITKIRVSSTVSNIPEAGPPPSPLIPVSQETQFPRQWNEPQPTIGRSAYPFNKATFYEAGHMKEYDSTPGGERIHEYHKAGTFYEINPDGSKVSKIVGDDFEVVLKDKKLFVSGDLSITVAGNCRLMVQGDMFEEIKGNKYSTIHGNKIEKVMGSASSEVLVESTESVGKDKTMKVGMSYMEKIGGGYEHESKTSSVTVFDGDSSVTVKGNYVNTVGGSVAFTSSNASIALTAKSQILNRASDIMMYAQNMSGNDGKIYMFAAKEITGILDAGSADKINFNATCNGNVLVHGKDIFLDACNKVIVPNSDLIVKGISFLGHVHTGVKPGGGTSGPPAGSGSSGGGGGSVPFVQRGLLGEPTTKKDDILPAPVNTGNVPVASETAPLASQTSLSDIPVSSVAPGVAKSVEPIAYTDSTGVRRNIDVYLPEGYDASSGNPINAVILNHGGGWTEGSRDDVYTTNLAKTMAQSGVAVYAIDYSLGSTFPAQSNDLKNAISEITSNQSGLNIGKVIVAGDSAGAYNSLAYATTNTDNKVDGYIFVEPPVNLNNVSSDLAPRLQAYGNPPSITSAGALANNTSIPVLITHATNDGLVSVDNSRQLKTMLETTGMSNVTLVETAGNHGFLDGGFDQVSSAISNYLSSI